MKIVALAKDGYDYSSAVDDYIMDTELRAGRPVIEKVDPDSYEGESLARSLDIMEYPTLVAVDTNGSAAEQWRGLPLPTYDEISYFFNS